MTNDTLTNARPPADSPEGQRTYEIKRTMGRVIWFLAIVLAGLMIAGMALGKGFTFGLFKDGPQLTVTGAGGNVEREQVEEAQAELAEASASASDEIQERPEAVIESAIEIGGRWTGTSGLNYDIEQFGAAATITELDAFGNITAVGQGTIDGDTFRFSYTTAAYTSGSGELVLSFDGSQLDGSFTDFSGTRPVSLF